MGHRLKVSALERRLLLKEDDDVLMKNSKHFEEELTMKLRGHGVGV